MNTPIEFGHLDTSALTALLFELAAELHVERTARLALQSALIAQGLLSNQQLESIGADVHFKRRASEAADHAVRRLLRTLLESCDERAPLRTESPKCSPGDSA